MPAAGPSVRISRAVRRRPPGPVLWARGAPPPSVSAPVGPPPVWRGAVRLVLCSPADSARCRTASAGPVFSVPCGAAASRTAPFGALPAPWRGVSPRIGSVPAVSLSGGSMPPSAPLWGPSSRNVSSVPGGGTSSSLPDVSPPPKSAVAASGPGAVSPSARTRMSWADVRPGALPEAGAPAPEIRSAPPSRGTGAPSRRMLRCSAGLWNPSVCPADRSGAAPGPAVFPRTVSC